MKQVDILNLEWSAAPSRDRTSASLVCNYLRLLGYEVVEGSIFSGYDLIHKLKPSLVFITNTIGAKINHEVIKYASRRGIPCVSLISEGNFLGDDDYFRQMIWGWNKERVLYEDIHLQWSERTMKETLRLYPELKGKVGVCGSVGFDLYQINEKAPRENLLKKYGKEKYKNIVGVAGWAFNLFHEDSNTFDVYQEIYSKEDITLFRKDEVDFNEELRQVVTKNQEILFILKEHPGATSSDEAGFKGLIGLPNVIHIKSEIGIIDCIQASDVWVVYDSTTMLESWLSGIPTFMINPNGTGFLRDSLFKGNPNYETAEEASRCLDGFFKGLVFSDFNELKDQRTELIKDIIQWDDGLNHVRAGNTIENILNTTSKKIKPESFSDKKIRYNRKIKNSFLKILYALTGKNKYNRTFSVNDTTDYAGELMLKQKTFYKNFNSLDDLKKIKSLMS